MKKLLILGITLGTSFVLQYCKPKTDPSPSSSISSSGISTSTTPQGKQTDDQSRVSDATSHVSDEANKAISNDNNLSGARADQTAEEICNVSIITVSGNAFYKKIEFNGLNCDGQYTRSGTAEVTFVPTTTSGKWKNAGSKILIKYTNVKITRVSDGVYITLNGNQTVTNSSGGNWFDLILLQKTLTNKIKGTYTVNFADGSARAWNEAKTRSLSYTAATSKLTFSMNGDTTLAYTGNEWVSDWGKNRNNDDFYTTIISPLTIQNCSGTTFKFIGGQAKHYIPQGTLNVLFSANSSGFPVNSCEATGYYLTWSNTSSTAGGNVYTAY